jgi:hypothetical protein
MSYDQIIIGEKPSHPHLINSAINCFYDSDLVSISKNSQSYWVNLPEFGISFWIGNDTDVGEIVAKALDGTVDSGSLYGLLWREACSADPHGVLATIKVMMHQRFEEGKSEAKAELRKWLID